MKVLWVTSQVLPLVARDLKMPTSGFGGWIMNMLNQLQSVNELEIGVAMVSKKVDKIFIKQCEKIKCYVAPEKSNKGIDNTDRDTIIADFAPDIIHIEGNEFGIHNAFSRVNSVPVLLSLQGILSGYETYQYGELPIADFLFSPKRHNVISSWVLYFRKHVLFNKRVDIETDTIKNVKHITGRTFWDRAHSHWINPKASYFSCNRILRPAFYSNKWDINKIEPHSLFVGNGYSPLKGLHFVISAVALLKNEFPDTKVYVAGICPVVKEKKISVHKLGYGRMIKKMIEENELQSNVIFTGSLNENEMVERMLKCNAYILPSLIENSPNTLGEAMLLGMPCISAYTGGASEMAIDNKECLFYRANDAKLLAWAIRQFFLDKEAATQMGLAAHEHALRTHAPKKNADALLEGYRQILDCNEAQSDLQIEG